MALFFVRFCLEVYPPNMQDSGWTWRWIEECWGREAADKVSKAVIICSGGTMGTPDGIAHYAQVMMDAMANAPRAACKGHDQRYHNYLYYTGAFHRVRVLRAGEGEVYHLGYLARTGAPFRPDRPRSLADTLTTEDGFPVVHNEDGAPTPVLHQYERFPELAEAARARWDP